MESREDLQGWKAVRDPARARVISPSERERIDEQNRALRAEDLLGKRLVFASGPYEAHVAFSNFCNMSCVMCWDGENPPAKKMAPELLERLGEQVAPYLSVVTPHNGSEPLTYSWEETRRIAERYSLRLALTTNVQFLDEQRFHELKDIVEMIVLSVDSHIPEIFQKIRPGGRPERVLENLSSTARLAREHEIECFAQIVFMTQNAAMLPETVRYMAEAGIETVNVIQMIDFNGRSGFYDPLTHFSDRYIDWIKGQCIEAARVQRIRLKWLEGEIHDFRERSIAPLPHKTKNDRFDTWARLAFPGYCKYAYDRLRIGMNGEVTPCCWAPDDELMLGSLANESFEQIWNGKSARDLRRAHLTWDYPSICASCRMTDKPPAQSHLPFLVEVATELGVEPIDMEPSLVVVEPAHMSRTTDPPQLRIEAPNAAVSTYYLALSLAGSQRRLRAKGPEPVEALRLVELEAEPSSDGTVAFGFPDEAWTSLRSNFGYWWTVAAAVAGDEPAVLRTTELRCLVRHEPIPRIVGSRLAYADEGHLPVVDLGGNRQYGWREKGARPARPALRKRTSGLWSDPARATRHRPRRRARRAATRTAKGEG
jgi:radical SAM protein with 4Fe4S-binding SPASM domain